MSDLPAGIPPAGGAPNMEHIPNANLAPSTAQTAQPTQPTFDAPQEHQNPRGEPTDDQAALFQQFLAWQSQQGQPASGAPEPTDGAEGVTDGNAPPTDDPDKVEPTELKISDNPLINESLSYFIQNTGYTQETLGDVLEAIRTGQIDGLNEASLAERVGAENAKHLYALAQANAKHVQETIAGYRREAHDAAGSEQNWTLVKQYMNQQASQAERAYVDSLWGTAGKEREAVLYAINLAKKAGAIQVGKPFTGAAPTSPAPRGITAQEHTEQRNALFAKYGRNISEADPRIAGQLQALGKQRELGRSSGI